MRRACDGGTLASFCGTANDLKHVVECNRQVLNGDQIWHSVNQHVIEALHAENLSAVVDDGYASTLTDYACALVRQGRKDPRTAAQMAVAVWEERIRDRVREEAVGA